MASSKLNSPAGGRRDGRVLVEDDAGRRPFMRGIMVHSLMARGVGFDEAFEAANKVREKIRGRGTVPRRELAKQVAEIIGAEALGEHQPPIPRPAAILVGVADESTPFSKGILAQSLLAASVDPSDAWEVARQIELELLDQQRRSVRRSELRRMAYQALEPRFGARTAARYLIWRKYQEPEKPVIILLGGTSGAGKTSLALEVARRLGISRVLSTDSIRQVMRIMLSPELVPAIHDSSFVAQRSAVWPSLDASGVDPVIQGFIEQASVVSVGVRAMIDRAIEENTSLILDGVSLVPGMIDLERYADAAHVIYLVVARMDEEQFRHHFPARERRQSKRSARRYVENLEEIMKIQEHILELADSHDIPIVDNVTIDGSVMLVIRHVVETLRESGGFDEAELL